MGLNEKGVAIGNEAVWTKAKGKKTERLLGMDLLRLGLERGGTAKEALDVILALLKQYGQGGNAGFDRAFYYDNSFLISDPNGSYVLETAGKNWAYKAIKEQANISNRLSLKKDYEASSERGDFKDRNIDPFFSFFSGSEVRRRTGQELLSAMQELSLDEAFDLLRHHHKGKNSGSLYGGGSLKSLCMHAWFLGDQTTGSFAVFYLKGVPYAWATGSSDPCLSLYKPVAFGRATAPSFADEKAAFAYWLTREWVNRAVYSGLIDEKDFKAKEGALQDRFLEAFYSWLNVDRSEDGYFSLCDRCAEEDERFYASFSDKVDVLKQNDALLPRYWQFKTAKLGTNVFERKLKDRK
jgi:dipeptidase